MRSLGDVSWKELIPVLLIAVTVALVSARPYAGGWNDGSRLAQVQSLVDNGTLAIDRSIFVHPDGLPVYSPLWPALKKTGTLDKVKIHNKFYSDKPPVPALLMAACYQVLKWTTGLQARLQPGLFVYLMTVLSSGLAYVAAVLCIYLLSRSMLPDKFTANVAAFSFALGSSALAYVRQVNCHEELLGVAAVLMVCLHLLPERLRRPRPPAGLLAAIGVLTGLGYCMDFAAGPLLLVTVLPLIVYRCRVLGPKAPRMVALFCICALPPIVLHHALNYHIGGVLRPVNAVPAYLFYPGSPFSPKTATGPWHHRGFWRALLYALALLFGKKGFMLHQPVLVLAFLGSIALMIGPGSNLPELPELLFCFAWSGAVWLIYAWGSNNSGGVCATIRWFVPLLVPGYYALMTVLRYRPFHKPEFLLLSAGGTVISALMWYKGPWMLRMVPGYWFITGASLLGFGIIVARRRRLQVLSGNLPE